MALADANSRLSAFVSFPSPYTQSLLVQALVATVPSLALSLAPFPDDEPPALQWADYDLMSFDKPHANPSKYLISSYIYRKALIRKHQLHSTIIAYLAKCEHRGIESILRDGGVPKGWNVEIQFADELDELLLDDLYELDQGMRENEGREEPEKRWWILKPGFADRAQGIRMFSTEEELRTIFESFEPPSSDEEDEDEDDENEEDEDGDVEGDTATHRAQRETSVDDMIDKLAQTAAKLGFGDDEREGRYDYGSDSAEDDEEDGTGVMTFQLRHFVIQEYMPRPVLFDITQTPGQPCPSPIGHKFHLRAYVLVTGGYTVHLARTMLALFSGSPYVHPTSTNDGQLDLQPHLTNTCLQTDAYGAPAPPEELVKLFWELEGLSALSLGADKSYEENGQVSKEWLDGVFAKSGEVIAEAVKAGAECGSFGLQFMPNAFEIFGVDLILSFPESYQSSPLPVPTVTLLEFNASPDFHQSGDRLRSELLEMFKGVVKISVAPFFGIRDEGASDTEEVATAAARAEWSTGEEKWGWRLVGKGEVRGSGW
ncbi:hypothetical protein IAU60_004986 [Kwoniella sp. DSM 27419]